MTLGEPIATMSIMISNACVDDVLYYDASHSFRHHPIGSLLLNPIEIRPFADFPIQEVQEQKEQDWIKHGEEDK